MIECRLLKWESICAWSNAFYFTLVLCVVLVSGLFLYSLASDIAFPVAFATPIAASIIACLITSAFANYYFCLPFTVRFMLVSLSFLLQIHVMVLPLYEDNANGSSTVYLLCICIYLLCTNYITLYIQTTDIWLHKSTMEFVVHWHKYVSVPYLHYVHYRICALHICLQFYLYITTPLTIQRWENTFGQP